MSTTDEPCRTAHRSDASAAPTLVRASDAEREATVTRLHQALGEGRLDLAEIDERVAAAYASRYRSDLPGLLADLPQPQPAQSQAPSWTEIWSALVWRTWVRVLGTAGSAQPAPTPGQCRVAALVATLAALWVVACAVAGAALVGS